MKKKMLAAVMTVVMAVVCMTGCSNSAKRDTAVKTAEDYGMLKAESFDQAIYNNYLGNLVFYISKDSEEADRIRDSYLKIERGVDYGIKETIWCAENIGGTPNEPVSDAKTVPQMRTSILVMTAKDAKSAKELYEANAEWILKHEGVTRTTNNVDYAIEYCAFDLGGDRDAESFYGAYLKGNTVIWIDGFTNADSIDDCTEHFCKNLELISPLTLRDNV